MAKIGELQFECGGEINEQLWGAGATLAAHFLHDGPTGGRQLLADQPDVVELGSGTGMTGLAWSRTREIEAVDLNGLLERHGPRSDFKVNENVQKCTFSKFRVEKIGQNRTKSDKIGQNRRRLFNFCEKVHFCTFSLLSLLSLQVSKNMTEYCSVGRQL